MVCRLGTTMSGTPLVLTVDVEGDVASDRFDCVDTLASVLDTLCLPATLFVTPAVVRRRTAVVREWVDGGHAVGLHVHPGRLGGDSDWLGTYDQDAVESFLKQGESAFEDHLGFTPRLFRAGRWSYSSAVHAALGARGFTADASYRPGGRCDPYADEGVTEFPMTVLGNAALRRLLRSRGVDGFPLHADAFLRTLPRAGALYGATRLAVASDRPYVMVSLHDYDLADETVRRRTIRYLAGLSERCYPETLRSRPELTPRSNVPANR